MINAVNQMTLEFYYTASQVLTKASGIQDPHDDDALCD